MAKIVYLNKGERSRKKSGRYPRTKFWKRISMALLLTIIAQNAYILYVTTN